MIVCDECEARTRQPIPADWLVVWLPEIRSWGHLCPEHRTDSGLMRPVLPPVPEASVLAPRALRVDEPLFAPAPVQPRGSDAPASVVDEHVGRVVHPKEAVILHFTGRVDDAGESTPESRPGLRAPRLIEPAPFVDVYDRPPLPRALREQTEMGWRVSGWGAA